MAFQGDSIFWVDTEKVVPNPFQPRREFDQNKLQELSESIRMYGVLQPLTVTRSEVQRDDGTFYTEYELIAGERRLRASRLAGVAQVPVIIREGEQNEQEKLELAIIENLQREDLNAIDRALAFQQLAEQFELSHTQVAQKVGRSREYVSNSIRLLALPEHMRLALQRGELGEGHARTLLMLTDRPQEQETIFREILLKKMSVREVERIVRKIATDKVRKKQHSDIGDHLIEIEKEFTETLGTRVQIQKTEFGGKLTIDYFSEDDLSAILKRMQAEAPNGQVPIAAAAMAVMAAATPLMDVADKVATSPERQFKQTSADKSDEPDNDTVAQHWNAEPVDQSESPNISEVTDPVPPNAPAPSPIVTESLGTPAEQTESHPQPEPEREPDPIREAHHSPSAPTQAQTDVYQAAQPVNGVKPVSTPITGNPSGESESPSPSVQPNPVVQPQSPPITQQESFTPVPTPDEPSDTTEPTTDMPVQRFFHNAFGFSRPAPDTTVSPESASAVSEQPSIESQTNTLADDEPAERMSSQPSVAEPEKPKDESEDIYSVRNFSI